MERIEMARPMPFDRMGAPAGAEEGTMQTDTWYDLAVRELSELTDHAKEMLSEAEQAAMAAKNATASTPVDDAQAEPPAA
jgi:hypothetical protein